MVAITVGSPSTRTVSYVGGLRDVILPFSDGPLTSEVKWRSRVE